MSASNFIWYELMTSDMAAAETFYGKVVGWTPQHWGGNDMPYTLMNVGEVGVAGIMNIPDEAKAMGTPPMWLGYIHAADTDKTTEAIRKAGGKVYREPADIPEIGRFSVVADPQGASFLLMTPTPRQPPAQLAEGAPGSVGWRELYTTDRQAALDFYTSQFGWTKDQSTDMGEMGIYEVFAIDGKRSGGIMNKPPQVPVSAWLFYFNVDDIDAAAERVKAAGGTVMFGPMEVPGGSHIIQAMDPQGAVFALVTPMS